MVLLNIEIHGIHCMHKINGQNIEIQSEIKVEICCPYKITARHQNTPREYKYQNPKLKFQAKSIFIFSIFVQVM